MSHVEAIFSGCSLPCPAKLPSREKRMKNEKVTTHCTACTCTCVTVLGYYNNRLACLVRRFRVGGTREMFGLVLVSDGQNEGPF